MRGSTLTSAAVGGGVVMKTEFFVLILCLNLIGLSACEFLCIYVLERFCFFLLFVDVSLHIRYVNVFFFALNWI